MAPPAAGRTAAATAAAAAADRPDVPEDRDQLGREVEPLLLPPTPTTELPGPAADLPLLPPLLALKDKGREELQPRQALTTELPLEARALAVAPEGPAPTTALPLADPTSELLPTPVTGLRSPTRSAPATELPTPSAKTFRATESKRDFDLFSMCQSSSCCLFHSLLTLYLLAFACWPCPLYQSNKGI